MKMCASLIAVFVLAAGGVALADPTLTVTYNGVNSEGNNTWTALVGPDPAFFSDTTSGFGSSLAVELAFAVRDSEFVDVSVNTTNWDFANPGNNPFTDSVTFGTWISDDGTLVFGAHGSPVFLDAGPFELFSFETLGSDLTTIDYGMAASGDQVKGATIAQAGQNFQTGSLTLSAMMTAHESGLPAGTGTDVHFFTGYSGTVTSIPEPATLLLAVGALGAFVAINRRRQY